MIQFYITIKPVQTVTGIRYMWQVEDYDSGNEPIQSSETYATPDVALSACTLAMPDIRERMTPPPVA